MEKFIDVFKMIKQVLQLFEAVMSLRSARVKKMMSNKMVKALPTSLRRSLEDFCHDESKPILGRLTLVNAISLVHFLVKRKSRNELPVKWARYLDVIRRRYREKHQIFTGLAMLLVLVSGGGVCLSSLMIAQGGALTAFVGVFVLVCTAVTFLLALLETGTLLTVELVLGREA